MADVAPRRTLRSPVVGQKRVLEEQPTTASKRYPVRSKIALEFEFAANLAPLEMVALLEDAEDRPSEDGDYVPEEPDEVDEEYDEMDAIKERGELDALANGDATVTPASAALLDELAEADEDDADEDDEFEPAEEEEDESDDDDDGEEEEEEDDEEASEEEADEDADEADEDADEADVDEA